ncbi:MAG: 2-oxoacid:acceptor oxidoreductase family protein [Dehalococcoidia bacterium]|nr:2-oxoacid:acceptor oxidoreductase family protein [Dehalococcoidia bacterium]
MNSRLLEIRWHGRGGQGAITAAKILAQAAYLGGYRGVTAAPYFGAERRGAPVSASTRIAAAPVHVMSQVENPDIVVVLDHTLLSGEDVTSGLNSDGWLVVNTWHKPQDLDLRGPFNVATADATRVCYELGLIVAGLTVVNTAILGALVRATEIVDLPSVEKAVATRFSDSALAVNLAAIRNTYEATLL